MNNKSKVKIGDLSGKINKSAIEPLSDPETKTIVGGRWCPPARSCSPAWC